MSSPHRSSNLGGARPGSGRPAELTDRSRLTLYIEQRTKDHLKAMASAINTAIGEENRTRTEADREKRTSAGQLGRYAVRTELATLRRLAVEDAARRYRPDLGTTTQAPEPTIRRDPTFDGHLFENRGRLVIYVEVAEKAEFEQHAERINQSIAKANQHVPLKKDADTLVNVSELVRRGLHAWTTQRDTHPIDSYRALLEAAGAASSAATASPEIPN